jgi:hypothetical protein
MSQKPRRNKTEYSASAVSRLQNSDSRKSYTGTWRASEALTRFLVGLGFILAIYSVARLAGI